MQGSNVVVQSSDGINGPLSIPSFTEPVMHSPEARWTQCQEEDPTLHNESTAALESARTWQSHSDQQPPYSQRSSVSHSMRDRPRSQSGQFTVKDRSWSLKKPGNTHKRNQDDLDDMEDDERPAKQLRSRNGQFTSTHHPSPTEGETDSKKLPEPS